MNILDKIDELRISRGWSLYELATESGVTLSTLANMFSRKTQPSIKTLSALCEAFGMSMAQFFNDGDEYGVLSDDERRLINSYRRLNKKERIAINNLAENLQ